jgi:two-component system chemotaxis sensor kinase CheA
MIMHPHVFQGGMAISIQPQTAAPAITPVLQERVRILVVDDSFTTRTLEKCILETAGFDVAVAGDGVDAMILLRKEKFSLVVSDVEMPNMNGFELTEAIRREYQESLPVILVTSLTDGENRERGARCGARAYIVKASFDQTELLETIRRII